MLLGVHVSAFVHPCGILLGIRCDSSKGRSSSSSYFGRKQVCYHPESGCSKISQALHFSCLDDFSSFSSSSCIDIEGLSVSEAEELLFKRKNASVYLLNQVLLKYRVANLPEKAFQLLKQFLQDDYKFRPDMYSFSIVIHSFAKRGDVKKAQKVFNLAVDEKSLNINVYNALLSAYANTKDVKSCIKILNFLLYNVNNKVSKTPTPNVVTYSTVINVMCKQGMIDKAKAILETMITNDVQPNVVTYNSFLAAWSRKAKVYSDKEAATEAEHLLTKMEQRSVEYSPPDLVSYCTVVHALCNANEPQRAEVILFKLEEERGMVVKSSHTYNALLTCWARSNVSGAPIRVERLLLRMLQRYKDGIASIKPDKYSYQALIDSYAKCEDAGSAEKAEAILMQMKKKISSVKPNIYHYNSVISAWARSCESCGPQKAEALLSQMEKNIGNIKNIAPNAMSYSCVIDAWGKSKQSGSAKQALLILERMRALAKSGHKQCAPTIVTYNLVLNALINDPDEGTRSAEKCMNQVERKYQSGGTDWNEDNIAYTFSTMVNVYNKVEGREAVQKAEEILHRMKRLGIRPTPAVFNSVINIYAQSGIDNAGLKAESLLTRMLENKINPDVCTYNSILKCWSRSTGDDKVARSFKIFDKVRNAHSNADNHDLLITYNTFLSCCVSSDVSQYNTFEIALNTYRDIQNSSAVGADHITYATFLKVCAKFLPEGNNREIIAKKVFKSCCKDGQVSNFVLKSLHATISEDLYCFLLEGAFRKGCVTLSEIPLEWKCNVSHLVDRSRASSGTNSGIRGQTVYLRT